MNATIVFRRLVALLGGAALLAACSGPAAVPPRPTPSPSPSPIPTVAACPASGVAITAGNVEGAAGMRALAIVLTNCGTSDYTAHGYPVVRVLDAHRRPLDVTVDDEAGPVSAPGSSDDPPRSVTVHPGDRVTAQVLWHNTVTDSTVVATTGHYLQIAPAKGEPAQLVAPHGGIDLGNTGRLAVNPWAGRN